MQIDLSRQIENPNRMYLAHRISNSDWILVVSLETDICHRDGHPDCLVASLGKVAGN